MPSCSSCPTPTICAKSGCQLTRRQAAQSQLRSLSTTSKTLTLTRPSRKTVEPIRKK